MGVEENPTSAICETLRKFVVERRRPEGVPAELLAEFEASAVVLEGLRALEVSAECCRSEVPELVKHLRERRASLPDSAAAIVHLGVAGDRPHISLECRGVNEASFRVPDVKGWQCCGEPVVPDSAPVLFSSLRLPEILAELHDRGVNCEISTDAGRYVCNYIYFQSLHYASPADIPVLFVHVPPFQHMGHATQVAAVLCLLLAVSRQLQGATPSAPQATQRPLG
ncbi:unnamed protein product [Effrenium voratum]|uniref:Pyroglutamyl-peptidase I n=1 Tax=Effrenium voratum TaxID=2562239 RepID=A0AA36JGR8_9DINO|nr:unnamed protein product [Effrenium voratum]